MWIHVTSYKVILFMIIRNILVFIVLSGSDGTWRIKTNDKLDEFIRNKNITNYIKAQRLS